MIQKILFFYQFHRSGRKYGRNGPVPTTIHSILNTNKGNKYIWQGHRPVIDINNQRHKFPVDMDIHIFPISTRRIIPIHHIMQCRPRNILNNLCRIQFYTIYKIHHLLHRYLRNNRIQIFLLHTNFSTIKT